jgi:hypothetical protein
MTYIDLILRFEQWGHFPNGGDHAEAYLYIVTGCEWVAC